MTASLEKQSALPGSTGCGQPPGPPGFLSAHPGYRSTAVLDELRASEYAYLDAGGHIYLDYTGAGLPAQAQLAEHVARVSGGCFGNPHSQNPTSAASTELVERARRRCWPISTHRRGVCGHLHTQRERGVPAGRRGVPVRPADPVRAD